MIYTHGVIASGRTVPEEARGRGENQGYRRGRKGGGRLHPTPQLVPDGRSSVHRQRARTGGGG